MTSKATEERYRQWIDSWNNRDWEPGLRSLNSNVLHNGTDVLSTDVISKIREEVEAIPNKKTSIDMLIIDSRPVKLAARLIHSGTLEESYRGADVTGKKIEWVEHMFCWFEDGKIVQIATLVDVDGLRGQDTKVERSPSTDRKKSAEPVDLKEAYRRYVHSINTLTMKKEFPKYCQPHLTHNTRRLSIDEYRTFIEASFDNIQGLTFNVKEVIVDDEAQQLAARIEFTGRSAKEFMGIPPTGRAIDLCEHVYYAFDEGKITWVWALLDLEAYRNA